MENKKEAILQATLTLISQFGFHGTPMSKIAAEAGVGAGTIYRYFENKETLINDLFLKLKMDISAAMMVGLRSEDTTEGSFRKVWLNTFHYCLENPAKMVFLEQYHNSPFQTTEVEAQTMNYLAPIIEAFEAATTGGEIKHLPFEMLAIFAFDVTVAHAKRHLAGTLIMDDANLELAVQACWDAIKIG
jgi:AcrR family transcriptional regulator